MKNEKASSMYSLIDHTADMGVEVYGESKTALFRNAGFALFDLITDLSLLLPPFIYESRDFEGMDAPDLLINYLRELLYFWNGRNLLVGAIDILSFSETALSVVIGYTRYCKGVHPLFSDIKAVTYHQAAVRRAPDGWMARVIFDL